MAASESGSESENGITVGIEWMADEWAFTYHGGALEVARRLAPEAPGPWIDLSTGINPYAYPLPDLEPEAWSRLPEIGALARLEAAAARRYSAAATSIVAGACPSALSHIAAWGGRRVGADLQRFCIRLRPSGRGRCRGEAARGIGRFRRRDRGQSQQSGRADHAPLGAPRASCAPRTARRRADRRRGLRGF